MRDPGRSDAEQCWAIAIMPINGPLRCGLTVGHEGDHTAIRDDAFLASWPFSDAIESGEVTL
jgi:hypothetical protein